MKDHGPTVWQTAYRLLGNRADTADCFQDTLLAAFELSRAQPVRNLPGLLVRLATTRAIDRLRQRGRQQRYCADSQGGAEAVSNGPGPAEPPAPARSSPGLETRVEKEIAARVHDRGVGIGRYSRQKEQAGSW